MPFWPRGSVEEELWQVANCVFNGNLPLAGASFAAELTRLEGPQKKQSKLPHYLMIA